MCCWVCGSLWDRDVAGNCGGVVFQAFLQHPSNFSEGLKSGGGMCWGVDLFLKGGEAVVLGVWAMLLER